MRPQHKPGDLWNRAMRHAPQPQQLPLVSRYEVGAPFSDPETSREAAEKIAPLAANLRQRVLRAIDLAPHGEQGRTAEQIENVTGLAGNTVRPRLIELVQAGHVIKTERKRPTRSGRSAAVYEVTEAGRASLMQQVAA